MKAAVAAVMLIAALSAAHAFGLGEGNRFGKLGAISKGGSAAPPPPGCASPDAPNGVVDLSKCSNAYYVALIF